MKYYVCIETQERGILRRFVIRNLAGFWIFFEQLIYEGLHCYWIDILCRMCRRFPELILHVEQLLNEIPATVCCWFSSRAYVIRRSCFAITKLSDKIRVFKIFWERASQKEVECYYFGIPSGCLKIQAESMPWKINNGKP